MKGLFKRFQQTPSSSGHQLVTVLTNYQACTLGYAIKDKLVENLQSPVVLVSPEVQPESHKQGIHFQASLQNE